MGSNSGRQAKKKINEIQKSLAFGRGRGPTLFQHETTIKKVADLRKGEGEVWHVFWQKGGSGPPKPSLYPPMNKKTLAVRKSRIISILGPTFSSHRWQFLVKGNFVFYVTDPGFEKRRDPDVKTVNKY